MHFLNKGELSSRHLPKLRAGATVRLQGRDTLVLCTPDEMEGGCIFLVPPDALICKLPERIKVVDSKGEVVNPTKGRSFYVTQETLNPFHGLTEVPDGEI